MDLISNIAGRPQPKVTWWREGVEIAGTTHPSADEGNPAMLNQLFISTVTRDYYGSKLECRAQGSNLIEPVVKEITVQVHCKWIDHFRFFFIFQTVFLIKKIFFKVFILF